MSVDRSKDETDTNVSVRHITIIILNIIMFGVSCTLMGYMLAMFL